MRTMLKVELYNAYAKGAFVSTLAKYTFRLPSQDLLEQLLAKLRETALEYNGVFEPKKSKAYRKKR